MIKNIITFVLLLIAVSQSVVSAQTYTWEKVPVRTAEMRDDGIALGLSDSERGGEAFQMPWGLTVDPSDANNIYCVIDVSPPLRSINAGLTWDYIQNGITSFGGLCLSVKPTDSNILLFAGSPMTYDTRFAANHLTGIYRSVDKGDTWTKITSTRFNRENQFKGNFAFAWSGNTVYALQAKVNLGDTTQSILRSTDSGITWAAFSTVNVNASCLNIPYGTTTLYVSSSAGLYRVNPDNGAASIIDSKPSRKIVMHPSNGAIAYSVCNTNTSNNGVWKTSNLNVATPTWTQKTTGIHSNYLTAYQCFDIAISPVNASYMYCNYDYDGWAVPYPKYYSSNGGDNWTAVASSNNHDLGGLWRSMQMNSGGVIGKGFIVADTSNALTAYSCETYLGGVKRTTDGGATWRYRSHGIMGLSGYGFNATPSNMSQIAFDRTNIDKFSFITGDWGMYHSENFVTGTRTYASRAKAPKFPAGDTGAQRPYAIARKGDTIVVAVGNSGNNQTLSTSVNQGATWFPNNAGSTTVKWGYSLVEFDSNSENLIYAGFWRGTRANNQQDFTWNTPALARFVHHVWKRAGWDYVYSYVSGDKKVYKSTDKGASWSTPYTTFTGTGTVSGIVVDPANENQIYLLTYGVAGNSGVHKLTGGVPGTWVRKTTGITADPDGLFNYKSMEIDPNNGNNIYIGSFRSDAVGKVNPAGVHRTTDAGETWVNITGNLGGFDSWSMKVSPHDSVIYNQNAAGTWRLTAASDDVINPTIAITSPAVQNFYGTTSASLNIGGNASDVGGLDFVNYTLTGDTTGVGTATGTTAWTITALALNNGTSTLTVKATDLAGNEATDVITLNSSETPLLSPVPDLLFPYTDSAITIDGNPNEAIWAESVANDIGRVISGTKSGTASAKGLWDENYIYITIIGTDTTKNSGGTLTPYLYTSQEVYLDGRNNNGIYGPDDFHFVLGWNLNNYVWEGANKTSGVLLAVGTTASGYIVEVAIPWTLVGIQGTNSTNLGIDFQQNFNTTGGASRTGATSMYNYQNTNHLNTDNFGLVVLGTQSVAGGGEPGSSSVTKLTGYIAEWKFDETTGSTTVERVAAINGTIYGAGAVTRSAGRYGNTFQPFAGSSTIIVGSSSTMANIGTSTIVAIIRPTSDSGAIFDRSTGAGGSGYRRFELSAPYALWHYKDMITTDLNILSANSVLTQNEWQTVARTWNGGSSTAGTQFYVNGNLVSQGGTVAGVGANVNDGGMISSIANRATGTLPFLGKIDNLAIFDHVLTAQEHLDCAAYVQATSSTALDITSLGATLYGSMSVTYGTTAAVACFDYGITSGVYTGSTTAQNTSRSTVGVSNVIHTVSGLSPSTTYYYRLRNDNPAYEATGTELSFVTLSADATVPTLEIVYPISSPGTMTTQSLVPLLISGSASDNVALSKVMWKHVEIGTSGTCNGTIEWNVQEFPIQEGTNTCKITAFDTTNNQGTATLSIFRNLDSPVVEITSPVLNCWLNDGSEAFGTTSTAISFAGLTSDYNGVGSVTMSITGSTTSALATGTSSFTLSVPIGTTTLNRVHFTARDIPLANQGTATMAAGRFPVPTTLDATSILWNSAMLNGICSPNLNTSTVWFEYGLTSGVYIGSSSTAQIIGTETATAVAISLGALNKDTGYVFRLRSSNVIGETYGEEFSFTTLAGYTLEEITGLNKPLSWSLLESTKFLHGMRKYNINIDQQWRSTKDKARLIADTDNEITLAIERN